MLRLVVASWNLESAAAHVFCRLRTDDSGVTAIEYGLIAGAIAVAIIATVIALGPELNNIFGTVQGSLATVPTGQ